MNLPGIALRNLAARRSRSLGTLAGIALAVAAVVALTALAWGFESSWQQAATARGTDAVVTRSASQNALPSPFDAGIGTTLRELPQVAAVAGLLSELMSVDDAPPLFVFGWELHSFLWEHLHVVRGHLPGDDDRAEVVLGALAAEMLGKAVGDTVYIDAEPFVVAGIFESSALVENGAAILSLNQMQGLTEHPDRVNMFNIRFAAGAGDAALADFRAELGRRLPGYVATTSADLVQRNVMVKLAQAMSWAVTVLAVLIGATGVFNTMLMSVFERTREIAVLLAIGWRRSRIVQLILFEALVLSLFGGVAGVALGVIGVDVLQTMPLLRGRLEAEVSATLMVYAAAVAVVLAVVGGLYPALRAAAMRPAQALHAE